MTKHGDLSLQESADLMKSTVLTTNCPKCGRLNCGCSNNGQSTTIQVSQRRTLRDLRSNEYLLRIVMTEQNECIRESAYEEILARLRRGDKMEALLNEWLLAEGFELAETDFQLRVERVVNQ